jgi:hypothetical protein
MPGSVSDAGQSVGSKGCSFAALRRPGDASRTTSRRRRSRVSGRDKAVRIVQPPTGILPRSCGSVARRSWQLSRCPAPHPRSFLPLTTRSLSKIDHQTLDVAVPPAARGAGAGRLAHEPRPRPPASGDGSWWASDEPGGKVSLADGCRGGCSIRFDRALARPNYAARENGATLAIHQRSR